MTNCWGSTPGKAVDFCLPHCIETLSGTHLDSCPVGSRGTFLGHGSMCEANNWPKFPWLRMLGDMTPKSPYNWPKFPSLRMLGDMTPKSPYNWPKFPSLRMLGDMTPKSPYNWPKFPSLRMLGDMTPKSPYVSVAWSWTSTSFSCSCLRFLVIVHTLYFPSSTSGSSFLPLYRFSLNLLHMHRLLSLTFRNSAFCLSIILINFILLSE